MEIKSGMVRGQMSRRALRILFEWSEMYQEELMHNRDRAKERRPLKQIAPLL